MGKRRRFPTIRVWSKSRGIRRCGPRRFGIGSIGSGSTTPHHRRDAMAERAFLLDMAGPVLAADLTDPRTIEVMCNDNGTCFVNTFEVGMHEEAHPGEVALDRFLRIIADAVGHPWGPRAPEMNAALPEVGWRIEAG